VSLDAGEQAGVWWWMRLEWSLVVDEAGVWWWIRLGSGGGTGWSLVVDEAGV